MAGELPHWNLESIYPGLHSAEFEADKVRLRERVDALTAFFDKHEVRGGGGPPLNARATIEGALQRREAAYETLMTLGTFLSLIVSVDAFNDEAKAEASALQPCATQLSTLSTRLAAYLGSVDLEQLSGESQLIADHLHLLERERLDGRHQMSEEAEEVAAHLDDSGGSAWARLHSELISKSGIKADPHGNDEEREYGMAELRTLQAHPQEEVRRRAYRAELELLESNVASYAAAMNSIKGQVELLARRRGWENTLAESLFSSAITPAALTAMQEAVRESFPMMRSHLKAKARLLGKEQLGWYDLFAPLPSAVTGGQETRFTYPEAQRFVIERFGTYSQELADFAQRTFDEGWLDVPPRRGKRNGAFCAPVRARGESRVMLNFGGSLGDVFTLAHELGHAYHNDCMHRFGRTIQQSVTPMTLAETASIFCETIVLEGVLASADDAVKLAVLEQHLQQAGQLILDIDSRFIFESTVLERRFERELSVSELNEVMLAAQDATYGDALSENERHPMMWAHKGHYYSSGRSFYNYPYTFGLLFGLGLFARYQAEPDAFRAQYDELLASTGLADAAELGARFGIDIEDGAFWRASLEVIEQRVLTFKELTAKIEPRTAGSN